MKILVVEDEEFTAETLATVLFAQHYAVEVAKDGQAAWELVESFAYDLILLDMMLPKLDGISLCRRLRSQGYHMPILLLTGRDSSEDKATGLDAGADDYLVKPFDMQELLARVRALLRRGGSTSLPVLEWGSLQLDPTTHEVGYGAHPLKLTPKEYALLELFLRNSRRVFSCGVILEHVWSYESTPGEEAVRTQIKGLRQKLKAAGAPADLIETVYGIGYRLKPLAAMNLPSASPETGEHTQQQTHSVLAGVWNRFKQRVSEQVEVLEQAAIALLKTGYQELQRQAELEAHTLAGSLGTFGFTEGSQLARKIEHMFQAGKFLGQKEAMSLRELVEALRQEIKLTPEGLVAPAKTNKDERPLLLIIDSDRQLAEELVIEANDREIRAEIATNLLAARDAIYQNPPNVVLLDLYFSNLLDDSLTLLAELSNQTPPVPVLVFTANNGLTSRIEVARLGGRAFLQKPLPPGQVLEAITWVLQQVEPPVARVMAVDDEPQILATLRSLLEPWGLMVTTLDDPRRFWETLEASSPELLILDVEMPYLSGIELCKIVRNDLRWGGLPVLFLTAHTEATIVNQVFAVGADDFVSKPIVGPELVTRIINRLERVRLFRSLVETDPLTRVSNRYKSTQDLDEFLSQAKRHNQPLCLAILDLDHFKQVNDRYGHATGDTVLRQLGQLLRRSFRSEDVLGRWGGEEFVVGMYGMTKSDAVQRLTKMLETLRQEEFIAPEGTKFQVTFSAGVAQYPEDGADVQFLYRSADAALYQAKAAGRDRVLSAVTPGAQATRLPPINSHA
jgi:diguanylate cyclase (GGDEF)-like protein